MSNLSDLSSDALREKLKYYRLRRRRTLKVARRVRNRAARSQPSHASLVDCLLKAKCYSMQIRKIEAILNQRTLPTSNSEIMNREDLARFNVSEELDYEYDPDEADPHRVII